MAPITESPQQLRKSRPVNVKLRAHRWTRVVHVYTSMICLLIVLFFSVTGLTLNHPTWTFGGKGSRSTISGTLPKDWRTGSTVDWLRTAEFLRAKHSLSRRSQPARSITCPNQVSPTRNPRRLPPLVAMAALEIVTTCAGFTLSTIDPACSIPTEMVPLP